MTALDWRPNHQPHQTRTARTVSVTYRGTEWMSQATWDATEESRARAAVARVNHAARRSLAAALCGFTALTGLLYVTGRDVHEAWPWTFYAVTAALTAAWSVLLRRARHQHAAG